MDEVTLFRIEEKFLKSLYDTKGVTFSKNKLVATINLTPEILLEKDYNLEYCDIATYQEGISYLEAIFRNKSNFYIYLSKRNIESIHYDIKIYFEPKDLTEVKFFIKKLLKLN